jgi:Tol biopolymer transport system component
MTKKNGMGEVRLLNTKTNEVYDITLGDSRATNAALSPDGNKVAYIVNDQNGSSMYLVGNSYKRKLIFDANTLNEAASKELNNKNVRICSWSKLQWSPDGEHISFFVCSDRQSALCIAKTAQEHTPDCLDETGITGTASRSTAWLDVNKIVFTCQENGNYYLKMIEDVFKSHAKPAVLYGLPPGTKDHNTTP